MPDDRYRTVAQPVAVFFADCRLNIETRSLYRADKLRHLEPKAFDLLLYLIEQRHRIVSKLELLDALWHTRYVSESALARVVMKVRRAIGDEPGAPVCIQTAFKIGYRFVGSLRSEPAAASVSEVAHGTASAKPASTGADVAGCEAGANASLAEGSGTTDAALQYCLQCGWSQLACIEVGLVRSGAETLRVFSSTLDVRWRPSARTLAVPLERKEPIEAQLSMPPGHRPALVITLKISPPLDDACPLL